MKEKWYVKCAAVVIFLAIITWSAGPAATAEPKKLEIALITVSTIEEPWNTSLIQSLDRVKALKPNGLDINWDISENVYPPDAPRVFRTYAKTGKYGMIWAHSASYSTVDRKKLIADYPEILWVWSSTGYKALGKNSYWVDVLINEPAYLLGIIAGRMTRTNVIGAVASYPCATDDVAINAFIDGAKSVNPKIKAKMTYIESWFDPPKAKESALAQIAAGADFIYAVTYGPFEACKGKGKYGFGHYVDQNSLAPEVIISSAIAKWDPVIEFLVDEWWNHEAKGVPYNAPMEMLRFGMKDGGSEMAPYHALGAKIPDQVKNEVEKKKKAMKDATFKTPLNEKMVTAK